MRRFPTGNSVEGSLRAELINPILAAAMHVIEHEIGSAPRRGQLRLERGPYKTFDVNVMVGVTGALRGSVFFGLKRQTALEIAGCMLGQPPAEIGTLADSGIAEMANVIAGRATIGLAEAGFESNISPPTVILGAGGTVSTVDIPRIAIPLTTTYGDIELQVALTD